MGCTVENNMEAESMVEALKMALIRSRNPLAQTIHHSDRGIQYCSKESVITAAKSNVRLSMTENGDPSENALSERMNRTITEECGMNQSMKSKQQVIKLTEEIIF